VSFITMTPHKH